MKKFIVMYHTESNHATQFMKVQAENKAEAKAIVRENVNDKVYFINVMEA